MEGSGEGIKPAPERTAQPTTEALQRQGTAPEQAQQSPAESAADFQARGNVLKFLSRRAETDPYAKKLLSHAIRKPTSTQPQPPSPEVPKK